VARGRVVHSLAEARELIRETGYPVIAKPDAGVGALNTTAWTPTPGWRASSQASRRGDYLMEEFITGDIHSFDGLADQDGKPVFFTGHVSAGHHGDVNEARTSIITPCGHPRRPGGDRPALPVVLRRPRSASSTSILLTASGEYVALESTCGPPAVSPPTCFNYAADIDIYRAWRNSWRTHRNDLVYERKYHCCYASRKRPRPTFAPQRHPFALWASDAAGGKRAGVFSGAWGRGLHIPLSQSGPDHGSRALHHETRP